jgi:hypothetical protein
VPGGWPWTADGTVVGSLGVSGGTVFEDEEIALAALEAVGGREGRRALTRTNALAGLVTGPGSCPQMAFVTVFGHESHFWTPRPVPLNPANALTRTNAQGAGRRGRAGVAFRAVGTAANRRLPCSRADQCLPRRPMPPGCVV